MSPLPHIVVRAWHGHQLTANNVPPRIQSGIDTSEKKSMWVGNPVCVSMNQHMLVIKDWLTNFQELQITCMTTGV